MATKNARLLVVCSALLLGGLTAATGSRDEMTDASASPSRPFRERVAAYAELRQQIVRDLLDKGVYADAEDDGGEFRSRLGLAIRDARRHAQPGDIFSLQSAGYMRQVVQNALHGKDDILSEIPEVPLVRVNDFYPEGEPLATVPPLLLQQLEPLPQALQYRFLANHLILLDIDTALIVDFVANALPRSF